MTDHDRRFELGLRLLEKYVPDAADRLRLVLPNEPDLHHWAVSVIYGELCQRPQLSMRDRWVATLASLAATGASEDLLAQHVVLARGIGLSRAEILEVFLQTAAYAGFPRAVTATRVATEVLAVNNRQPGDPSPNDTTAGDPG